LWLYGYDGALFEFMLVLLQCSDDYGSDAVGKYILRPDLDNAGAFPPGGSQQSGEIKVMGKDDIPISPGPDLISRSLAVGAPTRDQ